MIPDNFAMLGGYTDVNGMVYVSGDGYAFHSRIMTKFVPPTKAKMGRFEFAGHTLWLTREKPGRQWNGTP